MDKSKSLQRFIARKRLSHWDSRRNFLLNKPHKSNKLTPVNPNKSVKFIQISPMLLSPEHPILYALDSDGQVWQNLTPHSPTSWACIFPAQPQPQPEDLTDDSLEPDTPD